MRSLGNFSSSQWLPLIWGSWSPQLAGTTGGGEPLAQQLILTTLIGFPVLWHLRRETWAQRENQIRPYLLCRSCPETPSLHNHCLLIRPPKLEEKKQQAHVTSGRRRREAVGVIWLQTLPVSCRLEFYASRWSLQLALCCRQTNEHVHLSLPASSWIGFWRQAPVWLVLYFHRHGKKDKL